VKIIKRNTFFFDIRNLWRVNQAMKAKSRIEQKREEKADKREVKV
jgi:hypothetical protein